MLEPLALESMGGKIFIESEGYGAKAAKAVCYYKYSDAGDEAIKVCYGFDSKGKFLEVDVVAGINPAPIKEHLLRL